MGAAIKTINDIFAVIFTAFFTVLFFLSVKKCFWKQGKSKVVLFILSFITSPLSIYVISVFFSFFVEIFIYVRVLKRPLGGDAQIPTGLYVLISISSSILYLALILFFAWLNGKWIGIKTKQPIFFLYLMYNTMYIIMNRGAYNSTMFSIPYMGDLIDFIGTVILGIAVWLFYVLDIRGLAELAQVRVKVNWYVFLVPPAVFTLLYSVFIGIFSTNLFAISDDSVLIFYVFTTIFLFLFIWSFYVIIKNINATNEAVKAEDRVKTLSVEVMEALAHTIDAKDEYTRGHSARVAKYSKMLAEKLGLSAEECENVYYMALLHDIGKIGVPNEIINSPTKLTEEEYAVIKTHPSVGYQILEEIKSRPDLSIGARWHHERYDGTGYPDGKAGTDIPFFARIIAVADSYDAMTSNRSYRGYMAQSDVCSELEKNSGTQFDPDVAKAMIELINEDRNYEMRE